MTLIGTRLSQKELFTTKKYLKNLQNNNFSGIESYTEISWNVFWWCTHEAHNEQNCPKIIICPEYENDDNFKGNYTGPPKQDWWQP